MFCPCHRLWCWSNCCKHKNILSTYNYTRRKKRKINSSFLTVKKWHVTYTSVICTHQVIRHRIHHINVKLQNCQDLHLSISAGIYYPHHQSRSAWVRCSSLSVCLEHNSNTYDPKVFKLRIGMTLGYPRNDMVWGLKGHRLGSRLGLGLRQQQYGIYYGILHTSDQSTSHLWHMLKLSWASRWANVVHT